MRSARVLQGRDDELVRLGELFAAADGPRCIALRGPAGIGKTVLADALTASMSSTWSCERVAAVGGPMRIPFGPFSHLLGTDSTQPDEGATGNGGRDGSLEPPDLLWAMRSIRSTLIGGTTGRPLLVVVDDAHDLDDASAFLVRQLALTGEARLLITVRTGEATPAAIGELLAAPSTEPVDLAELTRDDIAALAHAVLGGPLEQRSLDRLVATSGGNPLFVTELLADALSSGTLTEHRGLLRWPGPSGGVQLSALVERRLAAHDPELGDVLDLLCVGEPLHVEVARRFTSLEQLAELERSGIVASNQDGTVLRFAHPLFGEVRRAQLGALARELIQTRLADAIETQGHSDDADRIRVVCWRLDCGAAVRASELAACAALATRRGDLVLAERLAREARGVDPTPEHELLLAEVLELGGAPEEAASLLGGLAPLLEQDRDRARAIAHLIRILCIDLDRPGDAAGAFADAALIRDPGWRAFVEAQWATTLAMLGRTSEGLELGLRLFDDDDPKVRLRAVTAVNLGYYSIGRLDEACEAATAMFPAAFELADAVPSGIAAVGSALVVDLFALGDLERLEAMAASVGGETGGVLTPNGGLALLLQGWLALRRGNARRAVTALSEAADQLTDSGPYGRRAMAEAMLCEAAALTGQPDVARHAAQEAAALLRSRAPLMLDLDIRRGVAWAPVASGALAAGRRRLLEVARDAAAAGHVTLELDALHDAVRLGAGQRTRRRLVAAASDVAGPRAAARAAHARALIERDAAGLEAAASGFEAIGELLVAAEVLGAASRAFAEQGITPAAIRTARRAAVLLERCDGVRPPVPPPAAGAALTNRELQVSRLAVTGAASREIAATLGVSVRTVDNHLGSAYAKLAVNGRSELRDALELLER